MTFSVKGVGKWKNELVGVCEDCSSLWRTDSCFFFKERGQCSFSRKLTNLSRRWDLHTPKKLPGADGVLFKVSYFHSFKRYWVVHHCAICLKWYIKQLCAERLWFRKRPLPLRTEHWQTSEHPRNDLFVVFTNHFHRLSCPDTPYSCEKQASGLLCILSSETCNRKFITSEADKKKVSADMLINKVLFSLDFANLMKHYSQGRSIFSISLCFWHFNSIWDDSCNPSYGI